MEELGWFADAPLFIFPQEISAFHDVGAIANRLPLDGVGAVAGRPFPEWLANLYPSLMTEASDGSVWPVFERRVNASPEVQLIHLTLDYLVRRPDRIKVVSDLRDMETWPDDYTTGRPGPLVMLDLGEGTKFMPMAVECSDGEVVLLHDDFAFEIAGGKEVPVYPAHDDPDRSAKWIGYWKWFSKKFSPTRAMLVVERGVAGHGDVRWIDYRVPLGTESERPLHLHFRGNGRFPTGVYAYYLVKRTASHGVRLLGVLKEDLHLNVLAAYSK